MAESCSRSEDRGTRGRSSLGPGAWCHQNPDSNSCWLVKRKAVVYVRQSTQAQVQMNLESQRRQYDLVGEARRLGFRDIEVIDDDLGRSASGTVARPGFEKLVAWLCAGEVGAVLCLDASRLARK